jgi:dTDP-4-dehydrorhamnose reductase
MKILITGKNGQLGYELQQSAPTDVTLYALGSNELDITDSAKVTQKINDFKPDVVINSAAYTAVDKAESDSENAFNVNAKGPENLALACKQVNAKLIHISTDFVFNGDNSKPYLPNHSTQPIGVYGESKLAGEKAVERILAEKCAIIRTSWVYSSHGNNFVKTMLHLMANKPSLTVVADQIGSPTYAYNLAIAIWQLVKQWPEQHTAQASHKFHWSDLGVASWYDFAVAIQALAIEKGMLTQAINIAPIPAEQYPTPAARPHFSVMDTSQLRQHTGLAGEHWRTALSKMLTALTK